MTKFSIDQEKQTQNKDQFSISLLDHSHEIALLIDLTEPKITFVNSRALDILGHDKTYVYKAGKEIFSDIIHPDDYTWYQHYLYKCRQLKNNTANEVEVRLKTKKEGFHWFNCRHVPLQKNKNNQVEKIICFAQNVHGKRHPNLTALDESHLLNTLFNTSNYGISICQPVFDKNKQVIDFSCLKANDAAHQILGQNISRAHLKGVFPNAAESGLLKKFQDVVVGGEAVNDAVYYSYNGRVLWLYITISKLGKNIIVTFTDITEHKQVEEKLHVLSEYSTEVITRWDKGLKLIFANSAFASKIGSPVDELLDKNCLEMGQPEDIAIPYMEKIRKALETGEVQDHYHYYPTPQGDVYYHARMVPEYNPDGKAKTVLVLARDIRELKESKEILQSVFDASINGILMLENIRDENGDVEDFKIVLQNKVSADIYGNNIIGERFGVLFPTLKDGDLFQRFVNVVETGRPLDTEKIYTKKDHTGWYRWSVVKINNGLVLFFEDITKRKKAELALKEEQNKLEEANELMNIALKASKAGLGKWDWNDHSTTWDKRGKELIGFRNDEEMNSSEGWINRIHPDDRYSVIAHSKKAMESDEDFFMEYRVVHDDGSIHHLLGTGRMRKTYQGKPMNSVGLVLDISDLKKAQEKIEEDAHFISKVADTIPDFMLILDLKEGRVKYINRNLAFLTGHSPEEMEHMQTEDLLNIIYESDRKKFMTFCLGFNQAEDEEIKKVDFRINTPEDNLLHIHGRGKVFKRDKVNVVQIIVTFQDITENKKTLEALIESEKLSLKGSLARTIMHEVRGPLNNIDLAVEIIRQEISDKQDFDPGSYLNILSRNSKRINELISELLRVKDSSQFIYERLDLSMLLEESIAMAEDRIYLTGLKIDKVYETGYFILGNKDKLEIALLNIIINAIEAMDAGSGHLILTIENLNKATKLSIWDNGCGMSPNELNSIFRANFSKKKTGMGIGLSNVHSILNDHNAEIEINSQPGEGTEFIIYFEKVD